MNQIRRSIRLSGYDYSTKGAYFVTICVHDRICLFGNIVNAEVTLNDYGNIVSEIWRDLPSHYPNVEQDASVIMPNHVHGIVLLHRDEAPGAGLKPAPTPDRKRRGIPEIMRGFKTFSARKIKRVRRSPGARVWQRSYFDRIIRNEEELNRIREYVLNNPANWGRDHENPEATCDIHRSNQTDATHFDSACDQILIEQPHPTRCR